MAFTSVLRDFCVDTPQGRHRKSNLSQFARPIKIQYSTHKMSDQKPYETNPNSITAEKVKVKKPSLYAVLLINDDYTPMEFVVHVLMKFFQKTEAEAQEIMLQVHHKGHGVCGIFTREIAETKATRVVQYSQEHEYPLQTRIVPA
jgi:ATP-dependent Clp protease adaptor protein ClpS